MRSAIINILIILLVITAIIFIYNRQYRQMDLQEIPVSTKDRINHKLIEAYQYVKSNKLNENIAVLIDMGIHSGKYRLFVVDLKNDSILKMGLVAHGCGKKPWGRDWTKKKPKFSNTPESHLSSLGKYKIGKRGFSNWGIHVNYKLHGLDSTNSNALSRLIVLHSWEAVKDEAVYPKGTLEGWGCPAVSNNMMTYLDTIFKKEPTPVLLWIYK